MTVATFSNKLFLFEQSENFTEKDRVFLKLQANDICRFMESFYGTRDWDKLPNSQKKLAKKIWNKYCSRSLKNRLFIPSLS